MSLTNTDAALRWRRSNAVADLLGRVFDGLRFAELTFYPIVDLIIRLWLAQVFWSSGLLKLLDWEGALYLSANEYPVSWMDSVTAAYIGVSIEVLGPIFLVLGFATRLAALPMLILSLVIQFEYIALNQHLFWAALFGWYVVIGAGPISLDHQLGRGLAGSALPFAGIIRNTYQCLSDRIGSFYQLFIRLCMVLALVYAASEILPAWIVYPCALLLVLGLASRLTALIVILAVISIEVMVTGAQQADHTYWLMLLGLIASCGPGPVSLDKVIEQRLHAQFPQLAGGPQQALDTLPHVVVVVLVLRV